MRANIKWKNQTMNVELFSVNTLSVSFRIYAKEPNYAEAIEHLANKGADCTFYENRTFVIVKRNEVSSIEYEL